MGDLRRAAGQAFTDAVAEEVTNLALDAGILLQYGPQFSWPGLRPPSRPLELDVKFALMRSPVSSPSSARPTCCSMVAT